MSWVPIPLLSPPTVVFRFLRTGALCVVAHVSGLWCVFGWFFAVPAGFLGPGERQPGAQERPQGHVHQQCYVRLPFLPTIYCRLLRRSSLWFLVWTLGDDACCDFAARWMLPGAGRLLWSMSRTACARPSGRSMSVLAWPFCFVSTWVLAWPFCDIDICFVVIIWVCLLLLWFLYYRRCLETFG